MNFVGIDLHKKTISVCVVDQERNVLDRKRFYCCEPGRIETFFGRLGPVQAVVEATAGYEWLVKLIESLADRVVLAHPKKLRIIAESTHKRDKLDAQVLAAFLALDMIPEAYRPSKRERAHRVLVRHRHYLSRRITSVRNKIRRVLSNYNADRENLFTEAGLASCIVTPYFVGWMARAKRQSRYGLFARGRSTEGTGKLSLAPGTPPNPSIHC